jgi:hypothetical protein
MFGFTEGKNFLYKVHGAERKFILEQNISALALGLSYMPLKV